MASDGDDEQVEVRILSVSGDELYTVTVRADSTIGQLKMQIAEHIAAQHDEQRLFFGETELTDIRLAIAEALGAEAVASGRASITMVKACEGTRRRQRVEVSILSVSGDELYTITVRADSTIGRLKKKIAEHVAAKPFDQCLLFGETELWDIRLTIAEALGAEAVASGRAWITMVKRCYVKRRHRQVEVSILSVSGDELCTVTVRADSTIEQLKLQIAEHVAAQPHEQRLFFGRFCETDCTHNNCDILGALGVEAVDSGCASITMKQVEKVGPVGPLYRE